MYTARKKKQSLERFLIHRGGKHVCRSENASVLFSNNLYIVSTLFAYVSV